MSNKNLNRSNLFSADDVSHLLGVDDLKPLLHLATLVAPALLVGHQRDVGMLRNTLLAVTAVHTVAVLLITQVVIATRQRGNSVAVSYMHTNLMLKVEGQDQLGQSHL